MDLLPGQRLARGVCRMLRALDFAPLTEFVPAPGLRVDVIALGPKGELWIVECKSCRVDFTSDHKWAGYLGWCDRFFWAIDESFPVELLPADAGLIVADAYDAEIQRWAEPVPLTGARRKALTRRFARAAAGRLGQLVDPDPARAFPPPRATVGGTGPDGGGFAGNAQAPEVAASLMMTEGEN